MTLKKPLTIGIITLREGKNNNIRWELLEMDNFEAIGYMIEAMRKHGYDDKEITKMIYAMQYQFDMLTESEAGQIYDNWCKNH